MNLSIVSPCFNPGPLLAQSLASVSSQDYAPLQHVICDAASTDGTREHLATLGPKPGFLWRSEPDRGIYDGLNKALALADGDVVGWLNCDDVYPAGVLAAAMAAFGEDPRLEMVCGDAELFCTESGREQIIRRDQHYRGERFVANEENLRVTHLNACFFRRALLRRVGDFDTQYQVVADRDYMFRLMALAPRSRHLDRVTCRYRVHAGSRTMGQVNAEGTGTTILAGDRIWDELADLSARYLRKSSTDAQIRRWCRNMLNSATAERALAGFAARDLSAVLAQAAKAMPHDLQWPLFVFWRWRRQRRRSFASLR